MSESHVTIEEIREQPRATGIVLDYLKGRKGELSDLCSNAPSFCLTGCGSSYYLALTGSALLNKNGLSFASPGSEIFTSPELIPRIPFDAILPISRSGETTETVEATKLLKKKYPKARTVGMTCAEGSSIHELSGIPLLSKGGEEESIVMTKAFSSMLVAVEYLSKLISGEKNASRDFQGLVKDSREVVERSDELGKEIGSRDDLEKFVFLGTGKYYGLASEAMLKMKEMTLSWSEAYHPLEFRHGPQSIADDGTLATIFFPHETSEELKKLLKEIKELGAETLVVGGKSDVEGTEPNYTLEIPSRKEDTELSLYMPIVQFLGYYRAVDLGLDPDNPKNLTQVVEI